MHTLQKLMSLGLEGSALVGGTALSGFYTAHRRSDDLDLFTKDEASHKTAVLTVRALKKSGVVFSDERTSALYYHVNCFFENHQFTIDVVLDENLFRVGGFYDLGGGLVIANLETLLRMKSAALVSRSSEKDLSDLRELFHIFPELSISEFIELGRSIDGGVTGESMLASVGGTTLRLDACDFALDATIKGDVIHKQLKDFQATLIGSLQNLLRKQEVPPLGQLIRLAKKILK